MHYLHRRRDQSLSWGWCIATFNRHSVLQVALRSALQQSRPPSEIVIVDASEHWQDGRTAIERELSNWTTQLPHGFRLVYKPAPHPSSAAQRAICVQLARADVVFLLDDDSILLPDCAEKIMAVYEADHEERIWAIGATLQHAPPPSLDIPPELRAQPPPTPPENRIRNLLKRVLKPEKRFVPYDEEFPKHTVPKDLFQRFCLQSQRVIPGNRFTCRRYAAQQEPFESALQHRSSGEDSDISYRISRHALIVARTDAYLCHLKVMGGRPRGYQRIVLGALNPLLLHRKYSSDIELSLRRNRALLLRRLAIEFLHDLHAVALNFPRARGILFALSQLNRILKSDEREFAMLFQHYQDTFSPPAD